MSVKFGAALWSEICFLLLSSSSNLTLHAGIPRLLLSFNFQIMFLSGMVQFQVMFKFDYFR